MKSTILLITLMLSSTLIFGQDNAQTKVEQILSNFGNVALVKNLSSLKTNVESDITHIKSKDLPIEKIEPIRIQYEIVKDKYNYIFDEMKRDLITGSSKTNFEKLEKKYKLNIDELNTEYIKFQDAVKQLDSGKSLTILAVIGAGVEIFNFVKKQIDLHQGWKTQVQEAFGIFTPMLMKKFYLKDWSYLWPDYKTLPNQSSTKKERNETDIISRPYFDEAIVADIQLLKIDDTNKTKTSIKLTQTNKYDNIEVLQSIDSYKSGASFKIKLNTSQFIYFFSINDNKLELLYPISETKGSSIVYDNIERANYTYLNNEQNSLEIPNGSGRITIDSVGDKERWIILISKSEIFNATKFANDYLVNVNSNIGKGKLEKGTSIINGNNIDNYTIIDENNAQKYSVKDLVKIYDVQLNKSK